MATEGSGVKRKLTKDKLVDTVLWREIHASSDEEDEAETSKKSEDVQPRKRRKRQVPAESESARESGGDHDKDKDTATKRDGNKRKRKAPVSRDDSDKSKLIDAIKHDAKLIPDAVKGWVERYESKPEPAICELLLTMFEACGVKYTDDEDLLEQGVDEVVSKLVYQAKSGDVDDFLTSKQRELRSFKENLAAFWDAFVLECQNGPLFDEKLMDKCMDYATVLSCSPPRQFRHVATITGLQLVTSFISVAKNLCQVRETKQRQLSAEENKKRSGPRVASLNKVLSETHSKITKLEEMMRLIFRGMFMHRYRDVDPEIRVACIRAIGQWIISYPSYFLQHLYLKYLGWTLYDKNEAVRKSSVDALQALYEIDDNVPSVKLFTTRFSARMLEMADDVDVNVAVAAIGLLKRLLRHQRSGDTESLEVSPLYGLLIDESPQIRHAVGQLVYEQIIAMNGSGDEDNNKSEVQLKRLLTILREFAGDAILCSYVIDAVWDEMEAMKDWKCLTSLLLDETQELEEVDATNLCRILCGSAKKSVGGKMITTGDNRKPAALSKGQKETLEKGKKKLTSVMIKQHPKLLRKFLADTAKVSYIVEVSQFLNLELYSLKQQQQSGISTLELVKEAFFKHGDKRTLKACVDTLAFCSNDNEGDLPDAAQRILKETSDEIISKLQYAIKHAGETEDDYSLTVNLRRLEHLQLAVPVPSDGVFKNMVTIIEDFSDLDDEVVHLVLLNMFLFMLWQYKGIDFENPDDNQMTALQAKRSDVMKYIDSYIDTLSKDLDDGNSRSLLCSTVCTIYSDLYSLFNEKKLSSTRVATLGLSPSSDSLKKFWSLCERRLSVPNSDDDLQEEINQKDVVITSAAKLLAHDMVPKYFFAPDIISHYVLHGKGVDEVIKQLIILLRKNMKSQELCNMFLDSMKKAYARYVDEQDETSKAQYLATCTELSNRLSAIFSGVARNVHKANILKTVKNGIEHAFDDIPNNLSFLQACVLPFIQRLPMKDIREITEDIRGRVEDKDVEEDPSGWQPYLDFMDRLQERTEAPAGKPPKGAKKGKKIVEDNSEDEQSQHSEEQDDIEEEEEDDTPLYRGKSKTAASSRDDGTGTHTMRTRQRPHVPHVGSGCATEEQLPG